MSVASGFKVYRIPIKPVGQLTGAWTGNTTAVTYLDKGNYVLCFNYAWQVTVGSMSICQCIITKDLPFNSGGSEICGQKQNQMGTVGGTTPNGTCLQSNFRITADNTPIFVGSFNTLAGGSVWGVPANQQYDQFMNVLTIIQIR
jgi:hypothetical protein